MRMGPLIKAGNDKCILDEDNVVVIGDSELPNQETYTPRQ